MKFTDIVAKADKTNPNAVLEIELKDEQGVSTQHTLTLRNLLRLTDEESADVSKAMDIMTLEGDELVEALSEDEKQRPQYSVLADRFAAALRATADDKDLWDEFVTPLRERNDFKTWMMQIFAGYAEETRLGEADTSEKS